VAVKSTAVCSYDDIQIKHLPQGYEINEGEDLLLSDLLDKASKCITFCISHSFHYSSTTSIVLMTLVASGVPRNFFRGGGVQQIQLRKEDRENGDLGT